MDVRFCVYDILGREVTVFVNDRRDAGVHEVKCDGSHLASGVYFYRLQAGDFVQSKKLILSKLLLARDGSRCATASVSMRPTQYNPQIQTGTPL